MMERDWPPLSEFSGSAPAFTSVVTDSESATQLVVYLESLIVNSSVYSLMLTV